MNSIHITLDIILHVNYITDDIIDNMINHIDIDKLYSITEDNLEMWR